MENDDRQIGRILRRREVLALLGVGGGAILTAGPLAHFLVTGLTGAATPALAQSTGAGCVVKPELTEGPYFVDEGLNRSDIRLEQSDGSVKEGVPLQLSFDVSRIAGGACTALQGAQVDVWHCDALGIYSDVNDRSFPSSTVGETFLRGYQLTDGSGTATFTTIYPGWYSGRAVHIHFKIRTTSTSGDPYEFTSQLFFDDALTDQVHAEQPYVSKGQRNVRNTQDGIYRGGGDQLLLNAVPAGSGGYTATFPIALDLSDVAVGASDRMSGGRPPGPPAGRP